MIGDLKDKALKEGVPIIKDEGLAFLLNLIREKKAGDILELGTAVGYSAIMMAELDEGIRVDTIEKDEERYRQALDNVASCGLEGKIRLYHREIEGFVPDKSYDLIFVDAAKAQYGRYLEQFIGYLRPDGVMVFDNMIFHGLIYDVDSIRSRSLRSLVRKIRAFREQVQNDERFDIMLFDNIGDGILVLTRRKL